ncbi:MAG: NAD(P)H-hydrate dehydratase [Actinomycetota bacterium]|nr:NAD(P)H-hydrate dehydratase [Actinomycetota bacterium]
MEPLITPAETNRLDMASDDPAEMLMERAGLGVALTAVEMGIGYGDRVIVLAGRGNNGGDGYVAAKHLARRGVQVSVRSFGYPRGDGGPARAAAVAARRAGVRVAELGEPESADLIIDAVFGVGFRGALPEVILPWTRLEVPVLAVDVPSGLDATTGTVENAAFYADVTVTFQAAKTGHLLGEGPERSGELFIFDIGLGEPRPELMLCEEIDAPKPVRTRHAHKWSVGSVAVVGGSPGITGAAMLAARSAIAAGAGAATVICPGALQPIYATMDAGVMSRGAGAGERFTPDDVEAVLTAAERYDVLALGPGLGPVDRAFVEGLLERWDGPVVLDADGLNALDGPAALTRDHDTIITPHAGEFNRLTALTATHGAATDLARESGAVVLLKGNPTFVADGDATWVVASGGSELATIGTGDVLTGMAGAFVAGGLPATIAARSAAYHHGAAGARLAQTETVTATELASEIAR